MLPVFFNQQLKTRCTYTVRYATCINEMHRTGSQNIQEVQTWQATVIEPGKIIQQLLRMFQLEEMPGSLRTRYLSLTDNFI